MTKKKGWDDSYWLLLMQLYLKKPVGVKPLYSRGMVNLALELHIEPKVLYSQMIRMRQLETPRIERLWNTYAKSPQKLRKGVQLLRKMQGFNNADLFYEGVDVQASFEKDFMPVEGHPTLTPIILTIILDLYFRLTPNTMVKETPEVAQLARKMKVTPETVVNVLLTYQVCDPYLRPRFQADEKLLAACTAIWQRYGNDNPDRLMATASMMMDYFKK